MAPAGVDASQDRSASSTVNLPDRLPDVTFPTVADDGTVNAPPSAVAAAPSPEEAVLRFVQAEASRDDDTAFGLLAAGDRASVGSSGTWQRRHADLPRLRSATVDSVAAGESGDPPTLAVTGTVRFEPSLDEVRGLVPAVADASWQVAREDGGYRVAFGASRFEPRLPDAGQIPAEVSSWVQARQSAGCEAFTTGGSRPPGQWSGGLLGVPGKATRLCGRSGSVQLGPAGRFTDPTEATPIVAAFGPESLDWARVVSVTAPAPMRIVVAPLDDRWVIVGVL